MGGGDYRAMLVPREVLVRPFQDRSPVLGTNYLEFTGLSPKRDCSFALKCMWHILSYYNTTAVVTVCIIGSEQALHSPL